MLTSEQGDEFEQNGFVNGGKVISDAALTELTAALDAVLDKGPDGFSEGEPQPVSFRILSYFGPRRGHRRGVAERERWRRAPRRRRDDAIDAARKTKQ